MSLDLDIRGVPELVSQPEALGTAGGTRTIAPRACIVGPGQYFLSGITYYTYALCGSLSERLDVSAIFMRKLIPRRYYPGRRRVGEPLASLALPENVPCYDGVDWHWGRSIAEAARFLKESNPTVLVLQWWTAAVLHSYVVLALLARRRKAHVLIEFHETLDTAEERMWLPHLYAKVASRLLFRMASCYIAHSQNEADSLVKEYGLNPATIEIVPHAAYEFPRVAPAPRSKVDGVCNLLWFGVIRPYKGLEDLISAFSALSADDRASYRLTVVGETWEGWTRPAELIADSPYRDRITFVNRYVTDAELARIFCATDVVVLPYRRSSQSGPLQIAMGYGLPVVVTSVGGLLEAAASYEGSVIVEPGNPGALLSGIRSAASMVGERFRPRQDWRRTASQYESLISSVSGREARRRQ